MYCSAVRHSVLILFISIGLAMLGASASPSVSTGIECEWQSFEIRPNSFPILDNLAKALASPELQCAEFEIDGYTNVAEHIGFSMELSLLRAGSVMKYLISRGISRERMRPRALGAQAEIPNGFVRIINVGIIEGCPEAPQRN